MTEFNHSIREQIPPFEKYNYITIGDMERQPFTPFSDEAILWHIKDDRRLFLIALDRYADELQGKRIFRVGDVVSRKFGDWIITGEVTIAKKYESKVIWDSSSPFDLEYWYWPNTELTRVNK